MNHHHHREPSPSAEFQTCSLTYLHFLFSVYCFLHLIAKCKCSSRVLWRKFTHTLFFLILSSSSIQIHHLEGKLFKIAPSFRPSEHQSRHLKTWPCRRSQRRSNKPIWCQIADKLKRQCLILASETSERETLPTDTIWRTLNSSVRLVMSEQTEFGVHAATSCHFCWRWLISSSCVFHPLYICCFF